MGERQSLRRLRCSHSRRLGRCRRRRATRRSGSCSVWRCSPRSSSCAGGSRLASGPSRLLLARTGAAGENQRSPPSRGGCHDDAIQSPDHPARTRHARLGQRRDVRHGVGLAPSRRAIQRPPARRLSGDRRVPAPLQRLGRRGSAPGPAPVRRQGGRNARLARRPRRARAAVPAMESRGRKRARLVGPPVAARDTAAVAECAAEVAARNPRRHRDTLRFLDELIAIRDDEPVVPDAPPVDLSRARSPA